MRCGWGSNPRPPDHKSDALTTEPRRSYWRVGLGIVSQAAANRASTAVNRDSDRQIISCLRAWSITLKNDTKHVPGEKMTLTSQKDLDLIRDIAENRDEWRTFIAEIRRGAAEAVRSDDPTSERL
ncbi:hypothetical protein ElyMa_006402400 [Elysia marginata]|uniref:Uncharacterized protein n=1 Tax=Elysia marginata TaxID=1093978 RepID=A0AAV4HSB2_9GAST|nr:hypothetical protein ElyMa_006402400 [Elysia marginata]